ncbi:hypothetical protein CP97_11370 [Aurantiacibacter atlanticus]|uniref:Uncharacterized protein n=1 Tax=Aurantiacibacter atlanticus TaxID=1648404 RepID=A0A0H4VZ75_9SPHN|nr:hypothetical protein [Aurantiacibacter atlanticus]AKQ42498.1 hypothetical protein CP97_11370 [Aurantiacibacter atlanticus]MDF1834100.1 hypothetical protein [Alteraurantiacibacter sp. bin_em_oilr2.035]
MSDRYDGKPFLRLLDSYVLSAIGALDQANEDWLTQSEPHFRHTFGEEGSWREIVASRMQFPEAMEASILEVWQKGRINFLWDSGAEPDAVQFTHTFVDTNFPH